MATVVLNVGGTLFRTTKRTLCSIEESFFALMFRSTTDGECWAESSLSSSNPIFIDRDPDFFKDVLSYMRSHLFGPSDDIDLRDLEMLLIEADFYQLSGLMQSIREEQQKKTLNVPAASFSAGPKLQKVKVFVSEADSMFSANRISATLGRKIDAWQQTGKSIISQTTAISNAAVVVTVLYEAE